jgi:hypothetical protein
MPNISKGLLAPTPHCKTHQSKESSISLLTFLGLNLIYSGHAAWHNQQNIDKGALIFFHHHLTYMSKCFCTMLNAFDAPTKK